VRPATAAILVILPFTTTGFGQTVSADPGRPFVIDLRPALYRTSTDETWRSQSAVLTWSRSPNVVYLFGQFDDRPLGQGSIIGAGLTREWTSRLFTYSAITVSLDEAQYLPKRRADLDLNVKLLPAPLVAGFGATTIRYPGDRGDDVLSAFLVYYGPGILTYRYFRNWSDPGAVASSAQMIQAALERPGRYSSFLRFSWGNEAYLPAAIITPEAVSVEGQTLSLFYRHWLTQRGGILVGLERQTKEGGFRRSGGWGGIFYAF
jgi:YaiO family outer membrane protein